MQKTLNLLTGDARHFQIATLFTLLLILIFYSDFPPDMIVFVLTVGATLATQFFFYKIFHLPSLDFRSPFITSLSLCLLFKGDALWLYPLVGCVAMASKFLLRWEGRHIFNPANFAIVIGLLCLPHQVWVSPGQWGGAVWLGFLLVCFATLVLNKAGRVDTALFFLGSWAFLLLARALWLGDPLEIPLHNLQSGALLIFAFFMISDPMTTPSHRFARFIFCFAVAGLAFLLQYGFQIRESVFYALFFMCFLTPLLNRFYPATRYEWRPS